MSQDLKYFRIVIDRAEALYLELKSSNWLNPPIWDSKTQQYRHQRQDQYVLIYLKGIRYFGLLNAAHTLLINGHYNEMYILSRCMDEALDDASLFARPLGENNKLSELQERALKEFFQEEFENPDLPSSQLVNAKRDRPRRDKVNQAILDGSPLKEGHPHYSEVSNLLYRTFSGYIHGAYGHIMELVGDSPPRYHTRGMIGTPKDHEALTQYAIHVYRCLLMGLLAAKRLGMAEQADKFLQIRNEMESKYPSIASVPEDYQVSQSISRTS